MKIAVLGANGQVGAEVCLLLRGLPGVEVVPVSRNRTGSAFLRWQGMRCRHGSLADEAGARRLIGDCEVVLNFALAGGRPREAREANRRLCELAARAAAPGARIVYFSTLSVYRDFLPAGAPRGHTAYGREKLRAERDALRAGRSAGKPTWVFRLGHVSGELQGIHHELRRLVTAGAVVVPRGGEYPSNVVHTATIVDAALLAARAGCAPGTYDLLSAPLWSWREVLAAEAAAAGVELRIEAPSADPFAAPPGPLASLAGWARARLAALLGAPRTREIGLALIAHLPEQWNLNLQARNFQRRARAEIAALGQRTVSHGAFTIPPVAARLPPGLAPTRELLGAGAGAIAPPVTAPFPPDLPPADA